MSKRNRERRAQPSGLAFIRLQVALSNQALIDLMREMARMRQQPRIGSVVCTIDGYDHDPRELGEIPEVRAFCRRLVDQGFISFLEATTSIPELSKVPGGSQAGLGAFEVWALAHGYIGKAGTYRHPHERLTEFKEALIQANQRADALLGDNGNIV